MLPVTVSRTEGEEDRFLVARTQLLVPASPTESCTVTKISPQGYLTVSGNWVAMSPRREVILVPQLFHFNKEEEGEDDSVSLALGVGII